MPRSRPALAASLAALLLLFACGGAPNEAPAFDGARAFADLVAQVRIGPRPAGSAAAKETRELIGARLRQAGWPVTEQRFAVKRPDDGREVELVNLRATRRGPQAGRIWLAAHYDTKDIPGMRFLGANDGASAVAVLLELARVLVVQERPFTIELLFFDGEESFGPSITERDGLYGSRHFARTAAASGELARVHALVLLDMVGDRDLNLALDRNSAAWLVALYREEAARIDPGLVDGRQVVTLLDDHVPFAEAGLADVLAIIDFQFGARRTPGPLWHTAGDDLDAVAAASLNRVGRLALALLARIEQRALEAARAPGGAGR